MLTNEKALIVVYAADKLGEPRLEYQLYHTLVFYLAKIRGFKFPGYSFAAFSWGKLGSALISRQLARDTRVLYAKGLVALDAPSVMAARNVVSITPLGRTLAGEKTNWLESEGESYTKLEAAIQVVLLLAREGLSEFLGICHKAYVKTL